MKALVVYDSAYGNTKAVAEAISGSLGGLQASSIPVGDFKPESLAPGDLLVVGSPINGWRPTLKITALLSDLGNGSLRGVKAAAFDTRVRMFVHGDAARKIAHALKAGGADLIAAPMPFYVRGSEGPLRDGEIGKAESWAQKLLASVAS
ncbi:MULTISPECIES: flavodoxin family protein [unclassified Arthrobacter]|uniref:flavodoxin family protein n=1 Tax=unclassified Arthrobacter TaxID=235627 RepID=UPI002E07CC7C|nr:MULTISPECIES: flavodoxin domain-containing protein [unclassified Arthrobacter]MEC5190678.1 flavodoxin [Arthrobacter sp. MP_M4]MEC5202762.1 flavodoxin [Arthrobacter sp. MP_M7]